MKIARFKLRDPVNGEKIEPTTKGKLFTHAYLEIWRETGETLSETKMFFAFKRSEASCARFRYKKDDLPFYHFEIAKLEELCE